MSKKQIEEPIIHCDHCGSKIIDLHKMWSRAGHHWCSTSCKADSSHGTAHPIQPIMRKHKKKPI